jgi:hypothetical protein
MERRCGQYQTPLENAALAELQSEILGAQGTRYGHRKSPVFIGETLSWTPIVHYIAPHWKDVSSMLSGLESFETKTKGASPLIRAAVLSFCFVYIHPMSDGNGRISRFLVNDTLRRDNALPAPFFLPISATIASTSIRRRSYDQMLELLSRPFMQRYQMDYRFGPEQIGEDGVHYDLVFDAYEDANLTWRYLDLTDQVEYLFQIIDLTIEHEMREEASYLVKLHRARQQVKEYLEGPDADIDRIIRSLRDNKGQVSQILKKEFPQLSDAKLANDIVLAINDAFG